MNRHQRRAAAAVNRENLRELGAGIRWTQRKDPTDPRYVLVVMRIPNGGMPEASYEGLDAVDRINRFADSYNAGRESTKD